jgi:transposase, IS6 family
LASVVSGRPDERWRYEAMAMIRKGEVRKIDGSDTRAQAQFIAGLFRVAA